MRMYARVVKRLFAFRYITLTFISVAVGSQYIATARRLRCCSMHIRIFFFFITKQGSMAHHIMRISIKTAVCVCIEFNSSAVFALIKSHSTLYWAHC